MKFKDHLQKKVQPLFATIKEAERQENAELVNQDLLELGESSSITSENWNELCSNSKVHYRRIIKINR